MLILRGLWDSRNRNTSLSQWPTEINRNFQPHSYFPTYGDLNTIWEKSNSNFEQIFMAMGKQGCFKKNHSKVIQCS